MPTNAELRTFVDTEGREDKDKRSGKKTGDHRRYTLVLKTGEVLYTRISHGIGSSTTRRSSLRFCAPNSG